MDLRFISADRVVIGDATQWPLVGGVVSGVVQGTMPNGQVRVTLLAVQPQ